jgi:hypothetical protein
MDVKNTHRVKGYNMELRRKQWLKDKENSINLEDLSLKLERDITLEF